MVGKGLHLLLLAGSDFGYVVLFPLCQEGRSQWSPLLEATTAATLPSNPTGLACVGANTTSATVRWLPPASDGGSPVRLYQVREGKGLV
jgi:hypothetical protein